MGVNINMKIEHNDESILFSTTDIPDIFFTEYLPQATGDYIKVFLYYYFLESFLYFLANICRWI